MAALPVLEYAAEERLPPPLPAIRRVHRRETSQYALRRAQGLENFLSSLSLFLRRHNPAATNEYKVVAAAAVWNFLEIAR